MTLELHLPRNVLKIDNLNGKSVKNRQKRVIYEIRKARANKFPEQEISFFFYNCVQGRDLSHIFGKP